MFYHRKQCWVEVKFWQSSPSVKEYTLGKGKRRNSQYKYPPLKCEFNKEINSFLNIFVGKKKFPVSITTSKDVTDSKLRICLQYKMRALVHHRHSHSRVTQPFFTAWHFNQLKPLWENSRKQMNMGRDLNGTNTNTFPSPVHVTCSAPAVYFHPHTKRINLIRSHYFTNSITSTEWIQVNQMMLLGSLDIA